MSLPIRVIESLQKTSNFSKFELFTSNIFVPQKNKKAYQITHDLRSSKNLDLVLNGPRATRP